MAVSWSPGMTPLGGGNTKTAAGGGGAGDDKPGPATHGLAEAKQEDEALRLLMKAASSQRQSLGRVSKSCMILSQ